MSIVEVFFCDVQLQPTRAEVTSENYLGSAAFFANFAGEKGSVNCRNRSAGFHTGEPVLQWGN